MNAKLLEQLIESYRFIGTNEIDHARQADAFARMAELIGERSPETVERMERTKGLRA